MKHALDQKKQSHKRATLLLSPNLLSIVGVASAVLAVPSCTMLKQTIAKPSEGSASSDDRVFKPIHSKPYLNAYPRPALAISSARRTITPTSQRMRVAIEIIEDVTGDARELTGPIKNIFLTELHRTGRFEVIAKDIDISNPFKAKNATDDLNIENGRVNIGNRETHGQRTRGQDYRKSESIRWSKSVDAVLYCTITSIDGGSLTIDFRLENPKSRTIMIAEEETIQHTTIDRLRSTLSRMAKNIARKFPTTTARVGKVLVQDGPLITVNLGQDDRLIPGMNIFIVSGGSSGQNTPERSLDDTYVAQAYVLAVYENTSQAIIFDGTDYRVNDKVRLK